MSIGYQMLAYGGRDGGLFRAAILQSGSPLPVRGIASDAGQAVYDRLVSSVGCNGTDDTLECLRQMPYDTLKRAIGKLVSSRGHLRVES
jgi:acetylcholinesterase